MSGHRSAPLSQIITPLISPHVLQLIGLVRAATWLLSVYITWLLKLLVTLSLGIHWAKSHGVELPVAPKVVKDQPFSLFQDLEKTAKWCCPEMECAFIRGSCFPPWSLSRHRFLIFSLSLALFYFHSLKIFKSILKEFYVWLSYLHHFHYPFLLYLLPCLQLPLNFTTSSIINIEYM